MSFIFAGLIFVCTLLLCAFMMFAWGMATAPSQYNKPPFVAVFWFGTIVAALVAASHWISFPSW